MALDTSGYLLEGIRLATANNPFTFPPRTVVPNPEAFAGRSGRADYCLFVSGQAPGRSGMDVADPALRFRWVRNNGRTSRFDFDAFARRWAPMPGAPPEVLGKLGNSPRLIATAPDPGAPESPHALYVGNPVRKRTFTLSPVTTSAGFGSPPAGTVEVSRDKGELNFSAADLADPNVSGQTVYFVRQGFFDRIKVKGRVGSVPKSASSDYRIFLNPVPGAGHVPFVRIGYGPHLSAVAVPDEASLSPAPAAGTFKHSLDTGRVVLSPVDVAANLGDPVYYDGVYMGELQLTRGTVGPILPIVSTGTVGALVGNSDAYRFIFYVEPPGAPSDNPRYYFQTDIQDSGAAPLTLPDAGSVVVDKATGAVYVSLSDFVVSGGSPLRYVDCLLSVEGGVAVQFYRSGVNGTGFPSAPDFVEKYSVSGQVVDDSLKKSPFVMVMTTPLVDSSFVVEIDQGPGGGGTFVGPLSDSTDPLRPGLGYVLDLDSRQLKFSNRKTATLVLPKESPTAKLPDAAISSLGLEATRNGSPIEPGLDFDFNEGAGILEFVAPVGENDRRNKLGVPGTFTPPNRFTADADAFVAGDAGLHVLSTSAGNFGFHRIQAVEDARKLFVEDVRAAGHETVDVRSSYEVMADRFWSPFTHPLRKVKVVRSSGVGGAPTTLRDDEFSVLATTSQVNLSKAAAPDDVFLVTYVSLDSPDEGVTVERVTQSEYAAFKVRQEDCVVDPVRSVATFNPDGKTLSPDRPPSVYVDGVTQDAASFRYEAPGTLHFGSRLVDQTVVIDYWVLEAPGGNQTFNLLKSPMEVDLPAIVGLDASDSPVSSFNGDKRAELQVGGAILADDKTVFLIESVSYDSSTDTTAVTFNPDPSVSVSGVPLRACDPIVGDYLVQDSFPTDTVPKGTSSLTVHGAADYRAGTVVLLDGDPYLASAAKTDPATGSTVVSLSESVRRNYILPVVRRTLRPVVQSGSVFQTSKPAHVGYPFTLVRTGSRPSVLSGDSDYAVAEGGAVTLSSPHGRGDSISAMYVARVSQPAGTRLVVNYSHAVAPAGSNGLEGQKLVLSYVLPSPDTFYFRAESVQTFIPEVQSDLKASASSGSSGPSIQSRSSLQVKDMGSASLFFDEQHHANFDVVISRLLEYYNDLVNLAEDVVCGMDGRVVGGTDGRFRFDGNLFNPPRASFGEITNDIDDRVKLYDGITLTGFFTFVLGPVYGPMYEPNRISRIYPTVSKFAAALNSMTGFPDFGKTIGTFPVTKITSVGAITASASSAPFLATSATSAVIQQNGDPKNLIPPFAGGQKVFVYGPFGSLIGPNEIAAVSGTGPFELTFTGPLGTAQGGIVLDVLSQTPPKIYTNGRDLLVDGETGEIKNFTLPPPLDAIQTPVGGNEVIESVLAFHNTDIAPRRVPALDGLTLTDSKRPSVPPLSRENELGLLRQEAVALAGYGTATVAPGGLLVANVTGAAFAVGNQARFLAGPNAGVVFTVFGLSGPSSFSLDPLGTPLVADATGRDVLIYGSSAFDATTIPPRLAVVIQTGSAGPPAPGDLIGPVDSQLKSMDALVRHLGPQQAAGTGTAASVAKTLTDPSVDLSAAGPGWLVLVPTGLRQGVYKVESSTLHSLTVSDTAPFQSFPSDGPTPYVLIKPWPFLPPGLAAAVADAMRAALVFLSDTQAWASAPTAALAPGRLAAVQARITDLARIVKLFESQLGKQGKLYDVRYLWIKQRVDKKDGTLAKRVASEKKRAENTQKLLDDQAKLLIANGLT